MRTIGLMSGTSLDGVDGVLVHWPAGPDGAAQDPGAPPVLQRLAHCHLPLPPALRAELLALNTAGDDELHRAALAGNALARVCAEVVRALLQVSGCAAAEVQAIGAHGQTVRHRPGEFDGCGYTLQLINGALLAELSGIDVVCDLRQRDLAAGGQGAPLVPAFHARCFAQAGQDLAVLNLGGIANLSLLPAQGAVLGFDCGPGNVLLDLWCQQHTGQAYDTDGRWAAGGTVQTELLAQLLRDPYFAQRPPKSTGRDRFHAGWLARGMADCPGLSAQDVMATLAELTAVTVAQALQHTLPSANEVLVCGGGAHNRDLMARLARHLPRLRVASTATRGLPPDQVEAAAFAWLARAHLLREPGSLATVTGAHCDRVLGALYPAG